MGLFNRLFGTISATPKKEIDHPILGVIYKDTDNSWFAQHVPPVGCTGTPSLSIDGNDDGPNPESVENYQQILARWPSISPQIGEILLELNHNYFDDDPAKQLHSADAIWGTAKQLLICVGSFGSFSLTYSFNWQSQGDGHEITF